MHTYLGCVIQPVELASPQVLDFVVVVVHIFAVTVRWVLSVDFNLRYDKDVNMVDSNLTNEEVCLQDESLHFRKRT